MPLPALIHEVGSSRRRSPALTKLTHVRSLQNRPKTSSELLLIVSVFFFLLSPYFSFSHPPVCELIATQTLLDSISPTGTNSLPVRECKPSHSISLLPPLLSYLSLPLSLCRSLSHCGGLQRSTIPDWSSVIGLTLSSSAGEGISFCSDSILSGRADGDSDIIVQSCIYFFFKKR